MMSSPGNETERWGCNEEEGGGRSILCVCVCGVGGIQKRKHAVVPITD